MPNGGSRQYLAWSGFVVIAMLLAGSAPAQAAGRAIFKCSGADGKTLFSDRPCPDSDSQQALSARGGSVQPAAPPAPAPVAAKPKQATAAPDPADCSTWAPPDSKVSVEPPGEVDPELLPHDANGRPIAIFVSKRGPGAVAAACSAMVSACSQKSSDPNSSVDACFKSAPRCTTERPWDEEKACCPQTCWQKFAELRRQCVGASQASYKALFEDHCVGSSAEASPPPASP